MPPSLRDFRAPAISCRWQKPEWRTACGSGMVWPAVGARVASSAAVIVRLAQNVSRTFHVLKLDKLTC
jgi:hypothetical protein